MMRTNIRVVMQRLGIPIDEESAEYFDEMVNQGRMDLERYESLSPISVVIGRRGRFRLRLRRVIRRCRRWFRKVDPKPLPRGPYR